MKFVYLALLSIFLFVCLAFATDFEEFDGYEEHDESIHDMEEPGESSFLGNAAANMFGSMSKEEVTNHFKDIIRGFSDRGFEDCDTNHDNGLDESEIECFTAEKMGFSIKTKPDYVVHHYDRDQDGKLDKDEVWTIVEDKDPAIFKILPSTLEKNMLLMHGMQEGHISTGEFTDDGIEIKE